MKNRILLVGYYGNGNLGDDLLAEVSIRNLIKSGKRVSFTRNKPLQIEKEEKITPVYSRSIVSIFRAVISNDIVMFSGGSIFQDVTSTRSILYYAFIALLALLFRKKLYLVGQGVGPLNSDLAFTLTRYIFERAHHVSVRDRKSYDLVSIWRQNDDVQFIPDLVFDFKKDDEILKGNNTKKVGIIVRDIPGLPTELTVDYYINILQVCRKYTEHLLLIGFHYSHDKELINSIISRYDPNLDVIYPNSYDEAEGVLTTCTDIVTTRLHGAILSMICRIKPCCIGYDKKVDMLAEEYQLPILKEAMYGFSYQNKSTLESYLKENNTMLNDANQLTENKLVLDKYLATLFDGKEEKVSL